MSDDKYRVVNENGEEFGGPHETFSDAEADRDECYETYNSGHFYIVET